MITNELITFVKQHRDKGMQYSEIAKEAAKAGFKSNDGKPYHTSVLSSYLIRRYPEYRVKNTKKAIANGTAKVTGDVQAMADLIWGSKEFTLSQKVRLLNTLLNS